MRNPINQKVSNIKPSAIRKFFGLASNMDDVISLGVGEPDFATPWHIREAAIKSLRKGQTFYSANAGLIELREAIVNYYNRQYGIKYNPKKEVIVTIGASEAIDLVSRVMLDDGDEVIVPEPIYVAYQPCVSLAGGVPRVINLQEKNQFKLTPEELESAITSKTKVVLLCYPNNPTGAIMEKDDLEKIAQVIIKHDLFVVSDEIYSELTYSKKRHVSIASLPGMKERTIVLNGFSKAFAMTGWRLGYALGPSEIIEEMIKVHQFTVVAPATFAQYAAVDAINDSDKDVQQMRNSYNQRRRYLMDRFSAMNIECFEPKGAFYTFINVKKYGMTSDEFCEKLLYSEKLALVPGSAFGESGEGFVRISYAYSIEQLKEGMNRLEKFIAKL